MALKFSITYNRIVVEEDIPRLASPWREKIKSAIESRLTTEPELYGKPLRRSLKGYRKLRVGDYRIVFRIEGTSVKILAILHRSIVYKVIEKRI
ncbi:MAG: type II toxin-antitoxin system RelE/ParE family toxin [Candidatus Liptonbacteria bacterium]|nr:type II toxin-antitoxin system RelE/ParE family toxin [Candidatus Liptonbacteria bacterium]